MSIVILLALVAHVGYAGNDFTGALSARKLDGRLMTFLSWTAGSILYTFVAPFFLHIKFSLWPVLVLALLAVLFTTAYPIFLKSVKHGNATISGVIAGTFPMWTVLFSVIFYDDRPTFLQTLAIIVIISGVILSALHLTSKTRLHNLFNRYSLMAFIVSLMWGLGFALWKYPTEQLGWFETAYFSSVLGMIFSGILFYPALRGTVRTAVEKLYFYPVVNALTGVTATLAYSYAITRGNLSVIAPIAGSYSGLYAIMSYIKFKEPLTRLQVLGVVLTLAGVVALSVVV